jgi:FkbM family methyltransferase
MSPKRLGAALWHAQRIPEVLRCYASTRDAWKLAAGYTGIRDFPLPTVARFYDGTSYQLREFYDLETLWQIYFHRVYEVSPSDRCVIDAGANIGLFSCYAAKRAPQCRVYAIEPFPETYKRLIQHVKENDLVDRIDCYSMALSAATGNVIQMSGAGSPSQMFHVLQSGEHGSAGTVSVAAEALPAFLERVTEKRIDLFKMDIEGSEYGVLMNTPGECLSRISRLVVEYHRPAPDVPYKTEDLIEHLQEAGFKLLRSTGKDGYGILSFARRNDFERRN